MMNHHVFIEVLPPYVEIIIVLFTFVALIILQRPPFATSLGPNRLSTRIHLLLCCPLSLLELPRIFFNFQNITCTETLLHCKVLEIIFPTSGHSPQSDSKQESYTLFTPSMQTVPADFRMCEPNDLVVTPCTGLLKC
jgi:hypothetical protein